MARGQYTVQIMKTIEERINQAVLSLAEQRVEVEKTGFLQLWQLKNGVSSFSEWDSKRLPEYVESQKALGYTEEDLTVEAWISTSREWYFYIAATVRNIKNGSFYSFSNDIQFVGKNKLTKLQLEEAEAPVFKIIQENRNLYLNNEIKAAEFIEKGLFYTNNLDKMKFDKETHDYVFSVKTSIEERKRRVLEDAREELLSWAVENGSELLKLRIKHNQNWQSLAETEFALSHSAGFSEWKDGEESESWSVNNATLEQLKELEAAEDENPDHEIYIIRCKFYSEDGDKIHRTYLHCVVKTPVGKVSLYREIDDVSEDKEE